MMNFFLKLWVIFILLPAGRVGSGQEEPLQLEKFSHPKAEDVAKRLGILLGADAKIQTDEDTNTIFLWADVEGVDRAKSLIKRLDVPRTVHVLKLKNADPQSVSRAAKVFMSALSFIENEPNVDWVLIQERSTILFIASDAQADCVRKLIWLLDRSMPLLND